MTTRPRGKIEGAIPVTITVSGSEYKFLADPNITRIQINDRPQAFRTDQSQAFQGQYRDPLSLGGITDAFGARTIGPWDPRGSIADHLAHGHIHVLHDCEAETGFNYITSPRQRQAPALPTASAAGDSVFGGGLDGGWTEAQMFNDMPLRYYTGSAVSGFYGWSGLSPGNDAAAASVQLLRWSGSAFTHPVGATAGAINRTVMGRDLEVHKGALCFLYTLQHGTSVEINSTTTGNTLAGAWANAPAAGGNLSTGTRLLDDGDTLWCIGQQIDKTIVLWKTADQGATAWTRVPTTGVAANGQLRSRFKYYDETGTARLMFMTEDAIYWIDETNGKAIRLWTIPGGGRAAVVWGGSLYIALDAMVVIKYTQLTEGPRTIEFITPGGGEAMPSGKDFRYDTDGNVQVWGDATMGPAFLWSGDGPTGGTLNRPLCLQWLNHTHGWRFGFRLANTTNHAGGFSARAIGIDPSTGDLLGFIALTQAASKVDTVVQIAKFETDPRQLSANIFETAGLVETPLVTPPPSEVTTTALDMFYNSENVASGVTIQTKFGVDGAAATASTLDTSPVEIDLAKRYFPSDATAAGTAAGTEGVGSNFNTIRWRHTFAGTATVGPLLYNSVIGYTKPTDAKDIILVDVIVDPGVTDMVIPAVDTLWTNIATVRNSKTKVTLNYSKVQGDILLLPIAEARMRQLIPSIEAPPAQRTGTVRFVLAQV